MIEDNPNWACMQPWYGYAIAEYILRTLVPASPLNVSEHREPVSYLYDVMVCGIPKKLWELPFILF
jgi:hypothetical protein